MRKIALGLLVAAAALFLLLPLVLFLSLTFNRSTVLVGSFFAETYLTIIPGLATLGLALYYFERLFPQDKSKVLRRFDYISLAVFGTSAIAFVITYASSASSVFHRVKSILPEPLSALGPDLYTFCLWFSFFWLIIGAIYTFQGLARAGVDRGNLGGLIIAIMTSFFFALSLAKFPLFKSLENTALVNRYAFLRSPSGTLAPGGAAAYCQAPYDDKGEKVVAMAPPPPGVRDDIRIVGISNETIEKVNFKWPLDWNIYADLASTLGGAENGIILFDISFVDEKGLYGGDACGVILDCRPLSADRPPRRQVDILAESFSKSKAAIISDYPLETSDQFLKPIRQNPVSSDRYNRRVEMMYAQNRLTNVKNGQLAEPGLSFPNPAVEPIGKAQKGAGYANILKNEESGMNWQMPLVQRVVNLDKFRAPGYDSNRDDIFLPGIDLIVAALYYGIDLKKDVAVDYAAGTITLSNIPEKYKEKVNLATFENEKLDIMARPNASRTIVIPIDRRGQMHISFRGGQYCFPFQEILEVNKMTPAEGAANFKDKIVLVAMYYATGVGTAQDIHLSPYGDMAGIEHHAYAINTILNQDFIYEVPPVVNLLILLAVGLIMGFYQPRVATWLAFVFAIVIAAVYSVMTLFITFQVFNVLHVFPTVIILQFVQLVGFIGFRVLTEEENVKFIRNTFSKFVSQDVVEELLSNPEAIALGGSKKEISVFFSDVRGFTTISEALGPEELVNLLNEYLSEMTELIIEYRGTIDKYMGDAIMAFWGAPAKNDDHAYYACVASLAQYHALQSLQKRWSERNIPVLDIGIGINTGMAVVGNMGSSRRMDYTLMGDTVNLGSRLEGATKNYGVKIIISEFTYERVKDRVYARELDLVRVKGKLEPVRIYELMALKNDADVEALKISNAHKDTAA
ncbi:MAG TPA: adenylate/guanylate cyclase domain-containing protein [Leptospiraceae bacterium]|nr:adenylate/guanylate cyclase domain-containing protein [Leptospiraceae bacterium]